MLSTENHRRDVVGLRYVYPVISRRAGGVSIGVNLNINNACNWACVYCQVEGLSRGGPPPIELDRLESELAGFLHDVLDGDFMQRQVPAEARRLVDVAFSGNGEPTSAHEFEAAVERVGRVLEACGLVGKIPVRLITNGSLMHRPGVQAGLRRLAGLGGEIWFKVDRALPASMAATNGIAGDLARVARHLALSAELAPTWVQTCWFAVDGASPGAEEVDAYCNLLLPLAGRLAGIHLYGLARPSAQPGAERLRALPPEELAEVGRVMQMKTGIKVTVSP